jgi:hypothetical protein
MIKFIVAALWISFATTGAAMYAFKSSGPEDTAGQEPNAFHGLDYVKSGVVSVPMLRDGRVEGYFLARLVFTAETKKLNAIRLPVEALISDEVYSALYGSPEIDFADRTTIDVEAFRASIRDRINERIGDKLIHEVLVEQMDFLAKNDTHSTSIRNTAPQAPGQASAH